MLVQAPRADGLSRPGLVARGLELTAARIDSDLLDAVRRGCSGGEEINAAYRDYRWSVWEQPVTALQPHDVREVASRLLRWTGADLVRQLPTDSEEASKVVEIDYLADHPSEYLRGHQLSTLQTGSSRKQLPGAAHNSDRSSARFRRKQQRRP